MRLDIKKPLNVGFFSYKLAAFAASSFWPQAASFYYKKLPNAISVLTFKSA